MIGQKAYYCFRLMAYSIKKNHSCEVNGQESESQALVGQDVHPLDIQQRLRQAPSLLNFFSCSTQLSTKFILLINVKMPTIVGILTFISMINTTSERLKTRNFLICWYFSFYEQLKFRAQFS